MEVGVWYVFGKNMAVVCKSALLSILEFFNVEYACVGAILHFGKVCVVVIFGSCLGIYLPC